MAFQDRPFSDDIWDEVETWSRDRIETYQLEALRNQIDRVAATSSHYRAAFQKVGFAAGDLRSFDDLRRLPITRKSDYVT